MSSGCICIMSSTMGSLAAVTIEINNLIFSHAIFYIQRTREKEGSFYSDLKRTIKFRLFLIKSRFTNVYKQTVLGFWYLALVCSSEPWMSVPSKFTMLLYVASLLPKPFGAPGTHPLSELKANS